MDSATTNTQCLQKNLRGNLSGLLRYSSKLDQMRGPLHTISEGNLVDEYTGDWLVLETPPHDAEDRMQNEKKNALAIDFPEAKNGTTGEEHLRQRMSLGQYMSDSLFSRKQVVSEDPHTLTRRKLYGWVEESQDRRGLRIDMQVLEVARKCYGLKIGLKLGGDCFEHALVERKVWVKGLEEVAGLGPEEETP
jgi:hypothetical protein